MVTTGPLISSSPSGVPAAAVAAMQEAIAQLQAQIEEQQTEIDNLQAQTGTTSTVDGGTF